MSQTLISKATALGLLLFILQAIFSQGKVKAPLDGKSEGQKLFVLSSKANQEHLTSFLSFK
ncbi:conserved hypothetical protein [Streptococcus equi subsp. zooepidemicus ATCC 35246]|nr:conserved hypothetical protein [Streptococcus equi subsp. zooepidemicus ATCC 35246]AIA68616.1 hypothetical protein Q426_02060 [Streptococcus equi subsp. zooepidemicus CY]HEL1153639.1 hypothetical protein [Streptococcus equi subsp. zooepidemicus]